MQCNVSVLKWLYFTCLFRLLRLSIVRSDPAFFGRTNIGEMNSPGSWAVSTITAFLSKLETSDLQCSDCIFLLA